MDLKFLSWRFYSAFTRHSICPVNLCCCITVVCHICTSLEQFAQVQYNYNTSALQEFFLYCSCIALVRTALMIEPGKAVEGVLWLLKCGMNDNELFVITDKCYQCHVDVTVPLTSQ